MKDEPDIVKELREAEKLGKLQSKVQNAYEELESDEIVGFTEDNGESEIVIEQQNTGIALYVDKIIFESSITANSTADVNGIINRVNPAFLKMWGYKSINEAIGNSVASFFKNQEDAAPVLEALKKTGKWEGEFLAKRKDGATFISKGLAIAIKNRNGGMIGYYSANLDVTEQKKAESNLKEKRDKSEGKYKTLFESSRDAIMMMEPPTWKFTDGNLSTFELFKIKNKAMFTSLGPWDISPEFQPDGAPSSEKAKKMIEKAMNEGSNFFEWTHKTVDGKEFPATVLLTRVEIEKGKPFVQATVRDIVAQKKAEEELKNKINELERFEKVTVGRELQMVKLKKKITELEWELKNNK